MAASLFSYIKWREKHPSLSAGDVCLVKHGHKVDNADYQLYKVVGAEKDVKKLISCRDKKEETY